MRRADGLTFFPRTTSPNLLISRPSGDTANENALHVKLMRRQLDSRKRLVAPFWGKKTVERMERRTLFVARTHGPSGMIARSSKSSHLLTSIWTGRATEYTSGE